MPLVLQTAIHREQHRWQERRAKKQIQMPAQAQGAEGGDIVGRWGREEEWERSRGEARPRCERAGRQIQAIGKENVRVEERRHVEVEERMAIPPDMPYILKSVVNQP